MKILSTLLFILFGTLCLAQETQQETYHRAKIFYNSVQDLNQLSHLGIALDHGKHKKGRYIESDFSESQINSVKSNGHKVELVIENVQQFYEDQNNPKSSRYIGESSNLINESCNSTTAGYTTPVNYNNGSMGGYLTYSEMLQELDDMKALYPDLITTRSGINTFTSAQGRTIQHVKISDNPTLDESLEEPQLLYTAIHHAREPLSLQQTIFYMWYLLENYNSNDDIKNIVNNTELFFVPCINPDGYIYNETINPNGGGLWRKNRRNNGGTTGVDNNRNYSYITPTGTETWNTVGTSGPNGDTYAGPAPFSEPENQAIRWLVEQNKFSMAINAHSSGDLLLYPFAYADNTPTTEDFLFKSVSDFLVTENNYNNIITSDLYAAAGASDDFMYDMLTTASGSTRTKVYAMTPEIGSSFWEPASQIESTCKNMLFLNISAAQTIQNFALLSDETPSLFIENTTASIDYKIKRIGIKNPGDFTVSINPVSANIISVGPSKIYNNMSLMEERLDAITINLDPNINNGDEIIFNLVVNNGVYDKIETISKKFGRTTTVLNEIGDDTSTNWDTTTWGISTTTFNSASSSITDSPNAEYANNQNKTIQLTNAIDLTAVTSANLSYYAKWSIENNFDFVQIQISTNNGASWIPQCGKFTNLGVADQTGANNEPLYDGQQTSWVLEQIDLSDYLGESILIRFQLITDGGVTEDGFYFDDLKVNVADETLTTPNFIKNNFSISPNPLKNTLKISSHINNYDYEIYTPLGQLVKKKLNNTTTTISCEALSVGMYLLKIYKGNTTQTFKFLKI